MPAATSFLSMKPTFKPHLPAPSPSPPSEPPQPEPEPTNIVARLRYGLGIASLTLAQVQPYLEANRRNAGSLLAAFWATGDRGLLQEAKERYPRDARVNLVAYFTGPFDSRQPASPERRELLESFKQSNPENALGHYLVARDCFKAKQTDKAAEELTAAAGKMRFEDYSTYFMQDSEEAWRAAGFSEVEAKAIACACLRIDPLVEVKGLGEDLVALANAYQKAGDATSAQAVLRIGLTLGDQLDQPGAVLLMRNQAGLRIQSEVLSALAPSTPYDDSGRTVAERLAEIAQRREALHSLGKQFLPAPQAPSDLDPSDSDLVSFFDRQKTFGAESALLWFVSRQGGSNGNKSR